MNRSKTRNKEFSRDNKAKGNRRHVKRIKKSTSEPKLSGSKQKQIEKSQFGTFENLIDINEPNEIKTKKNDNQLITMEAFYSIPEETNKSKLKENNLVSFNKQTMLVSKNQQQQQQKRQQQQQIQKQQKQNKQQNQTQNTDKLIDFNTNMNQGNKNNNNNSRSNSTRDIDQITEELFMIGLDQNNSINKQVTKGELNKDYIMSMFGQTNNNNNHNNLNNFNSKQFTSYNRNQRNVQNNYFQKNNKIPVKRSYSENSMGKFFNRNMNWNTNTNQQLSSFGQKQVNNRKPVSNQMQSQYQMKNSAFAFFN
ncbi:hypothetical protein M0812_26249 [Anaeramoeba flamelloides]|uniref:Uncharacterized protein n=1 Tax=Anaeramoeba flamelloides TaxID=1746091 RepID=A0AAV7YCQ2_9EUKA|nr:hypothetical protein M0812_26249 [Anaeramoeba flamelloides]